MPHISIALSADWIMKVHTGDKITFDTVIADSSQSPPASHTVPLSNILKFKPEKIFKHLKKNIGDKIYKGDVLAIHDGIFSTKKYIADLDGLLTGVNHLTGEVTLEQASSDTHSAPILSLAEGTVGTIHNGVMQCKVGKVLTIELKEVVEKRFGGRTIVTDNAHATTLTLPQVQGSVIIAPDFSEYVLSKLSALGATHIITPKDISTSTTIDCVLNNPDDIQTIIDFAPHAVYANASEKHLTFYL